MLPGGVAEALDQGHIFGHFEPLELQPTSPTQHTTDTTNRAENARMEDAPLQIHAENKPRASRLRVARLPQAVSG